MEFRLDIERLKIAIAQLKIKLAGRSEVIWQDEEAVQCILVSYFT